MQSSKIFSQSELKAIEEVKKGNRRDKTGVFYGRAKPKIIEMLEVWFKIKGQLKRLVKPVRKKK